MASNNNIEVPREGANISADWGAKMTRAVNGRRRERANGRQHSGLQPGNPIWAVNKTGADLDMGAVAGIESTVYEDNPLLALSEGQAFRLRSPVEESDQSTTDKGNFIVCANNIPDNGGGWVYESGAVLARMYRELNENKIYEYADIVPGESILRMKPEGSAKVLWRSEDDIGGGIVWCLVRLKAHMHHSFADPFEEVDIEWNLHDQPNGHDGRKLIIPVIDPDYYGADIPDGMIGVECIFDGAGHLAVTGGEEAVGTPSPTPTPTPTPTNTPTSTASDEFSPGPSPEATGANCGVCNYRAVTINIAIDDETAETCHPNFENDSYTLTNVTEGGSDCWYQWGDIAGNTFLIRAYVNSSGVHQLIVHDRNESGNNSSCINASAGEELPCGDLGTLEFSNTCTVNCGISDVSKMQAAVTKWWPQL